jgi:hypothetical protein
MGFGAEPTHLESLTVSYAILSSDFEHEVLPATSGHRVIVTCKLYWAECDATVMVYDAFLAPVMIDSETSLAVLI